MALLPPLFCNWMAERIVRIDGSSQRSVEPVGAKQRSLGLRLPLWVAGSWVPMNEQSRRPRRDATARVGGDRREEPGASAADFCSRSFAKGVGGDGFAR